MGRRASESPASSIRRISIDFRMCVCVKERGRERVCVREREGLNMLWLIDMHVSAQMCSK
jgi:hypothetical protein